MRIPITLSADGWSPDAKRVAAVEMSARGKDYLVAATLLWREKPHSYVVPQLVCQAIEVLGKAYLLWIDFDRFAPRLNYRDLNHDLLKIIGEIDQVMTGPILSSEQTAELRALNTLYQQHLLRYASFFDLLSPVDDLSYGRLLRKTLRLLRLADRRGVWHMEKCG